MKKDAIAIAGAFLFVLLAYTAAELIIPLPFGNKPMEFEIKKGSTFRQVVDSLAQKGFVRDRSIFFLLGKVMGIDRKIKAGYYSFWGTMTPLEIFDAIRRGKIIEYEITVMPGDSLLEVGQKFFSLSMSEGEEFQRLCTDREFLDSLDVDAPSLEGYLFPETYRFPKGIEIKEALSIMVNRLREKFDDDMILRTMELGLTERDVLTMASIVEKEAITDSERPIIAGVYYNRLKKRMLLQADPTAIYGVKSSREKITRQDLLRKTPYNTYVIKGLPPGPIASPGLKSITAALNPADVPYLYFVSNNDGTHNFSVTLSNHVEAVKIYRSRKKSKEQG